MRGKLESASIFTAMLVTVLAGGLFSAGSIHIDVAHASANVTGILHSDTTWTKANSPYNLTGPVAVDNVVTLIIEAGVTVNLNTYYIQVNGTLVARGSSTARVQINGGQITLTSVSNGWNEQTGSGSTIENAVLKSVLLSSSVPLKIENSNIDSSASIDGSSIILDSTLNVLTVNNGTALISNNKVARINILGGSPTISHNTIGKIGGSGGSPVISQNNIESIGGIDNSASTTFYLEANSPKILNNIISGGIMLTGTSPEISNNQIEGFIYGDSLTIADGYGGGKYVGAVIANNPIISFDGNGASAEIVNNTLIGHTYNYTHETFYGGLRGTTTDTLVTSGIVLSGNINGAYIGYNTISNCPTGINYAAYGAATIEENSFGGITISSSATLTILNNILNNGIVDNGAANLIIRNNTINSGGIWLRNSAVINFNNILNYGQNSIYLTNTPSNIDATNNWWGTTDTQAINQSIYDFKNDFNLGQVNFIPLLTESNPEAKPNSIPLPESTQTPTASPTTAPIQTFTPTPTESQTVPSSPYLSPSPSQNPTSSPEQTNAQAVPETEFSETAVAIISVCVAIIVVLVVVVVFLLRKKR